MIMADTIEQSVGIIGLGSMGGMIARKLLERDLVGALAVSNRTREKADALAARDPRVVALDDNREVASRSDLLFLCVKPAEMKGVLDGIKGSLKSDVHVVSINASVLFSDLESACPGVKFTKCVPSLTGEVGESVTLVCHNALVGPGDRALALRALSAIGTTEEIPESELGIVSELTSCMPGFIAALFRVVAREAGEHMSVDAASIERMLMMTLRGSAGFFLEDGSGFDNMIGRVATKGGITEVGVKVIDAGFPPVMKELFERTIERRELVRARATEQFCAARG